MTHLFQKLRLYLKSRDYKTFNLKKLSLEKPRVKRAAKLRNRRLVVEGQHYNLKEIFDRLNEEYFDKQLSLSISWFGNSERSAKRRRLLGSYCHSEQLVKIHRLLDHPHFPPYFISFIVYHEMLHHALPPIKGRRGRRQIHHGEFKMRERQFRDYALAQSWQKDNHSKFFSA